MILNKEATPYVAELLGTFGFVFIAAGAVAVNSISNGSIGTLGVALAQGVALLAFIYTFTHVSGAHLNPAITISLWVTKRIEGTVAAGYIVSQLAGAVLAGIFIEGLFGSAKLAVPQPISLEPTFAVLVEALLTFFLVLVFFGIIVDRRSHTSHAGLALGFVFAGLVLVGLPLTGAAINPAKAFGPALVANFWSNHLIYWIGPILGGIAAALVYEYGILRSKN